MQIHELMALDPPRCAPADTLLQAAERLCVRQVDVLPVCDADQVMLGSMTSRDICRHACLTGLPLAELRVADALNGSGATFARVGDPVERVLELMVSAGLWQLPIVDATQRLVGIAAYHKVLRRIAGARDVLMVVDEATAVGERARLYDHVPTWILVARQRELIAPDGRSQALSGAECRLLVALVEAAGSVLGRDTLTRAVMDRAWDPADRYVDVVVANLRRKLRERASGARAIRTVPNEGYVLALKVVDERRLSSPIGDTPTAARRGTQVVAMPSMASGS